MKSLSLELIKGVISGVDSKVAITWVIPRVMDRDSIKKQIVKLSDWMDKVYQVAHQVVISASSSASAHQVVHQRIKQCIQ